MRIVEVPKKKVIPIISTPLKELGNFESDPYLPSLELKSWLKGIPLLYQKIPEHVPTLTVQRTEVPAILL